jgi:hypothetical protein
MFLDALLEWKTFSLESTPTNKFPTGDKLMKLQHDAERKSFPTGLPVKEKLFAAAQSEAKDYFAAMDGIE